MKIVARKINWNLMVVLDLVVGIVMTVVGFVVLPVGVFVGDPEYLTNPYMWGVVIAGMLFFGLVGFFCNLRPFVRYCTLPEVQAETDGTYLYINSVKKAKIPLSDMEGATLDTSLPYMMSREFIAHLVSEQYGTVIIKVPGHGTFRLYYIARAKDVPGIIASLAESRLH